MTNRSQHEVQTRHFAAALILSPLLIALFSLVFFLIPIIPMIAVAAAIGGSLPYVIFGGPALYYWCRAGHYKPLSAAWVGFAVNIFVSLIGSAAYVLIEGLQNIHQVLFFVIPGFVFAMLWCAGFAFLYNRFTRRAISAE